MSNLLAARFQMAFSLGFHMIFAALGVGMPLLLLIAEGLWLRTRRPHYLKLAKTWGKATGLTFAVGAVSGTALSFELGLLWPAFMGFAGIAVGPAFTVEGFAFFTEAIFIGLYLYGWKRLSPLAHWLTGIPVAIAGAASSVLVVAADAWMQNPLGADLLKANPAAVDPAGILFGNPTWPIMAIHSTLATYAATAFAVAGIYAWGALRGKKDAVRRSALRIVLVVGTLAAALMPITGDRSAKYAARFQPAKLAAMESQFQTEKGAPLRIGGWPDPETGEVRYAIDLPKGLSFLAFGDFNAEVKGLDQFPRQDWPNVPVTHVSFQLMVVAGILMLAAVAWYWYVAWKRRGRELDNDVLLRILIGASPLGFLALETGWIVTEVGRQPWILYNVMRTSEAVTPNPHVLSTLVGFVALYLLLGLTLVWLLRRLSHEEAGLEAYGEGAAS